MDAAAAAGTVAAGYARSLLGAVTPAEVLVLACREALGPGRARRAFASYVLSQAWDRGCHVAVDGDARDASPAERAALFALYRTLAQGRAPVLLRLADIGAAVRVALAPEAADSVAFQVAPILHRSGRLLGLLAVSNGSRTEADPGLADVAALAGAALENTHRLSFARRDQDRLHLLAEASEEALWDWTPGAREVWWGGRIQDLLGRGTEAVNRRFEWKLERIHPDDAARVTASWSEALRANNSSWRAEYRLRRSDDTWVEVEERAYFLREPDGSAYRVVGSLRDISAVRSLIAREQEARAEAERANRAKDEFLAMLGHELRNPLAPIMTAVDLLALHGIGAIENERTVIERQARHLTRLVDDLLDVSRITRGTIPLRRECVELSTLVIKAMEVVSTLLEERRHRVELRVAAQGLRLLVDPGRFTQVIANLLANSAKYTEPGGAIVVEARADGGMIELAITDNGIGIDPEMQRHVFEMFVQERQALDRSRGGLGLGLSIVRSLVRLHGGEVAVFSRGRGQGACFTVRVPRAPDTRRLSGETLGRPAGVAGPVRAHRVLIVDDNEDAAQMLSRYLEIAGHAVHVAHDGPSALRAATTVEPELVLLDIGLPVLDGFMVARRLREHFGARVPRIVALTGYGHEAQRRRIREEKFDAHLVKPVDSAQLCRTLAELLGDAPTQMPLSLVRSAAATPPSGS